MRPNFGDSIQRKVKSHKKDMVMWRHNQFLNKLTHSDLDYRKVSKKYFQTRFLGQETFNYMTSMYG